MSVFIVQVAYTHTHAANRAMTIGKYNGEISDDRREREGEREEEGGRRRREG